MTHGNQWVFCGRREKHVAHGPTCPGTGTCGSRDTHEPHLVLTGTLAPYWCAGSRIRLYREKHVTTDRRKLLDTVWAEEPLPVMFAADDAEGHDGAEIVGRVDGVRRESGTGWVTGLLTLSREGKLRSPAGLHAEADFDGGDGGEVVEVAGVMVATGWRLRAVTLGERPCWDEMRIW